VARDVGRLSRLTAGCAGVAAGLFGAAITGRLLRPVDELDRQPAPLFAAPAAPDPDVVRLREENARLEAALVFKNDLTSMLTHDVAQPISSIASLAELLAGDWDDLPDDVRLELATKIDTNTQRLIKMMNDLQTLFRLDPGTVTARRSPVPLLEVVRTAATSDDVTVEIDDSRTALVDRAHLLVVLQNLLGNAATYGKPPITVRAEQRGDTVELSVRDHGPGIPEERLPRLFDRPTRRSGLGLFIVRHLVEANGGSVRYEHAEPHGAIFVVTLETV
jgi:signal transduction histidine kinase